MQKSSLEKAILKPIGSEQTQLTESLFPKVFTLFCLLLIVLHVQARPQYKSLQHIAVIENDAFEETLPNELRNPFYKTPRVRAALAKSSWFGPGEEPVFDREAEKISRSEIYNVLSHAGLIQRKPNFF